jgi:hypothetical protein
MRRRVFLEAVEQLPHLRLAVAFDQDVHRSGENAEAGPQAAEPEEVLNPLALGEVGDGGLVENRSAPSPAAPDRRFRTPSPDRVRRISGSGGTATSNVTTRAAEPFAILRPALRTEHGVLSPGIPGSGSL